MRQKIPKIFFIFQELLLELIYTMKSKKEFFVIFVITKNLLTANYINLKNMNLI
jgi:hypothetical protein